MLQHLLPMASRTLPVPQPEVGTLLAPHFSFQSSQADIFCERTCLQTNQAAVFSCWCLSAGDNSGFCLPTGNQPSAHHRHLPAPRGHFTWPSPRPAPGSAARNVPPWLRRHDAGGGPEGWDLPPYGKGKQPQGPAGTVGMVQAKARALL